MTVSRKSDTVPIIARTAMRFRWGLSAMLGSINHDTRDAKIVGAVSITYANISMPLDTRLRSARNSGR